MQGKKGRGKRGNDRGLDSGREIEIDRERERERRHFR